MRRAQGQSERQIVRRAQFELAGLVVLLLSLFGAAAAATAFARAAAAWVALLIVLGGAAVATAAWLLARIPAEMSDLARERRRAFADLLRVEEDERARIAGELHEDTVQVLTAALVTIDRMTPAVRARDTERIAHVLPPTRAMLAHAVERVRRLTFELHPPLLEEHGLPVALTDLIDRAARDSGFATEVVIEVGRYPFVVEDLAYRIVREAIADARAHAGTSRIEVDIREYRGAVHGRIWDDGPGAPARRADDRRGALLHLSLERLASRVRLAEGDIDIRSIPGRGTLVAFRLPLAEAERLEEERAAAI